MKCSVAVLVMLRNGLWCTWPCWNKATWLPLPYFARSPESTSEEPIYSLWLVGVLVGDDLLLFDTRRGEMLRQGNGEPLTLRHLLKNPAALDRLPRCRATKARGTEGIAARAVHGITGVVAQDGNAREMVGS
jgi:hypothetical protein